MNDENVKSFEEKIEKYMIEFNGLTDREKTFLAYHKIIELLESTEIENMSEEEIDDTFFAIVLASNHNISYLKIIFLQYYYNIMNKCNTEYKKSLVAYQKILNNYKKLAEELKINDTLELSHLFTYMLWNGYYSINKEYYYDDNSRLMLPSMYSFDIIKGGGVCLANAELLSNYLNVCQKESTLLLCKVPNKKNSIKINYYPNVKIQYKNKKLKNILISFASLPLKPISNFLSNHAVTLIKDNKSYYVYDPNNLVVLNILNENKASIINGTGIYDLKPITTLALNPKAINNQLLEQIAFNNISQVYSRKEIIFSFEKIIDVLNDNIKLLDDAYENIHSQLEIINNEIEANGGIMKVIKK